MLLEKITDAELEVMQCWHNPIALSECLFSDIDNLSKFEEDKFFNLRNYQYTMLSLEEMIDFDGIAKKYNLNEKEKFNLRKNVGDLICYAARMFGKTAIVEKLDLALWLLYSEGEQGIFGSIDLIHITAVLNDLKDCFASHPICSIFKQRITGAPDFKFRTKKGTTCISVNYALGSKQPGRQFYGKHSKRLYLEENSMESDNIYKKRLDAVSEVGAVFRISGMTNFTKLSPAGKTYFAPENKKKILNYPQFVNPLWDEKEKQRRIKEHGGEKALTYRTFVDGEIFEDGISVIDMERVRPCFIETSKIKRFELKKDMFKYYKNIISIARPINAKRIFISCDIGESAGTDIVIHSELDNKYNYIYNIILYGLTHPEQVEILTWLARELNANVIAIDCGDGLGRSIYSSLEKIFPKDNLVWYAGAENIEVGFETDNNNKIVIKDGKPVIRIEKMKDWSLIRLKHLLYELRVNIPYDDKLENQLSNIIATQSGTNLIYNCISDTGDHLFDAWRIFSIAQWLKVDYNKTKPITGQWGLGTF